MRSLAFKTIRHKCNENIRITGNSKHKYEDGKLSKYVVGTFEKDILKSNAESFTPAFKWKAEDVKEKRWKK
jgi:hypothetical protein